jgi:hypothetical protein
VKDFIAASEFAVKDFIGSGACNARQWQILEFPTLGEKLAPDIG